MNDDGIRYLLTRGRRVDPEAARHGRLSFLGEYWQTVAGEWAFRSPWGPPATARYFTAAEMPDVIVPPGAEWVAVFVNVPVDGGQA